MTLQAARASEVPAQWFTELPNDVPELLPDAEEYEVPPAYVAVESDHGRNSKKWRRGFTAAHPEAAGSSSAAAAARGFAARLRGDAGRAEATRAATTTAPDDAAPVRADGGPAEVSPSPVRTEDSPRAPRPASGAASRLVSGLKPVVTALLVLTAVLVLLGIFMLGVEPLVTTLVLIVAVATGFMAMYLHRTL